MTFRIARGTAILLFGIVILLFFLGWLWFYGFYWMGSITALFLGYLLSVRFEINDGVLAKTTLFFFKRSFEIKDIKSIEAITKKKMGYIYLHLTKGPTEDYYLLQFKDLSTYKLDAFFCNKGQPLGRYLAKTYRIKFKEKEIMQYLYGN
ncbi:hypothetical protein M3194_16955 [Paenibacillus glycanilyticus]|uniref:hypothetical protein n=1 Tax=Paenibacillus glycanilyticus TaxID=126569 RepID=UPI00203C4EB3|nr:hypothetical protein [Paenibacillus glycanilyticus]MCM3629038.1 hypothetical protein [Paenibacillus glycanilyticus]